MATPNLKAWRKDTLTDVLAWNTAVKTLNSLIKQNSYTFNNPNASPNAFKSTITAQEKVVTGLQIKISGSQMTLKAAFTADKIAVARTITPLSLLTATPSGPIAAVNKTVAQPFPDDVYKKWVDFMVANIDILIN